MIDHNWSVEGSRIEVVRDPVGGAGTVLRAERIEPALRAELRLSPPQSHPGGLPGRSNFSVQYYLPEKPPQALCIAQWHDSWDVPPEFQKHCDPITFQKWYGRGLFAQVPPPIAIVVRRGKLILELCQLHEPPVLKEDPSLCGSQYLSLSRPQQLTLTLHDLGAVPIRKWFELYVQIDAALRDGEVTVCLDSTTLLQVMHPTLYNSRGNLFKAGAYGDGVVYLRNIRVSSTEPSCEDVPKK